MDEAAKAEYSILIVDDNEMNRDALIRRLAMWSYQLDIAENGVQALEKMRTRPFDLVLLDIMMPEMNGYEVLEHMQSDIQLRLVPVIVISALDDLESVVRCIELGAEDYLLKPFNPVLFRARIESTLEKKRLREQEMVYLKRRDTIKNQFLQTVSHDLKNPLNIILGYTTLLEDSLQSTDDLTILDAIQRGARRMLALVEDVLDLNKIESGIDLNILPVSLAEFLKVCLADVEMLARTKNIQFVFSPPPFDVTVMIDPDRMSQVAANLLSNAFKYTPENGRVELAAVLDLDDKKVILKFIDNGVGIPEDDQPYLFDMFYRVKGSDDEHIVDGTGLGLYIVKTILDKHHEHVWVESKVGEGTTFSVTLAAQL